MDAQREPFLYVVVCAAGVATGVSELIEAARGRGWRVGVVATPNSLAIVDRAALEAQTGLPVRCEWRAPGASRPLPPPDAIAVAPATFNTVNKWAAGIADTLALAILCEAYGLGVPTAVHPRVNAALAAHPAYRAAVERLSGMGVRFPAKEQAQPRTAADDDAPFEWVTVLDLLGPPRLR
ncbi:flavoprotein [Kitasatospora sp. NPDC048365]|uniref:flavoprotein n=1 Tax=Kitasatospora sp. NPDC048365 TaxID=3364050 RepID=UPI0037196C82